MSGNVTDELQLEPDIGSTSIGIAAKSNVATLSGHVIRCMRKVDAERAVWPIKGVKAIAQKSDACLHRDRKVNGEIARRAVDIPAGARWFRTIQSRCWRAMTGAP